MESEEIVWNIFNKMRESNKRIDLTSFVDVAEFEDIDINFELLKVANMKLGARTGDNFLPEFVLKFISSYLKNTPIDKILDPWVKIGSFIIPLTEKLKPESSIGFIRDKGNISIIKSLQKKLDIIFFFHSF